MAGRKSPAGRLIAIDGTRGRDVSDAAARLWRHRGRKTKGGGVSAWDASGTFSDLWTDKGIVGALSPRTLVLVFASDLAFRLRWQIRPALEQGQTVIATSYVETAAALAQATGLSKKWVAEVFRFAPKADLTFRVKERKRSAGWKGAPLDGYLEFCAAVLEAASRGGDAALRRKIIDSLDALERRRGCRRLTKRATLDD
ncbi:MAG: hypothetical protein ACM3NQ_09860 [Bacteroidales bacterium]